MMLDLVILLVAYFCFFKGRYKDYEVSTSILCQIFIYIIVWHGMH